MAAKIFTARQAGESALTFRCSGCEQRLELGARDPLPADWRIRASVRRHGGTEYVYSCPACSARGAA